MRLGVAKTARVPHHGASRVGTMAGNNNGPQGPHPITRVEGTNVVRVPFGVRRARRVKPQRPEHWATLVLPFVAGGGSDPQPPQAA